MRRSFFLAALAVLAMSLPVAMAGGGTDSTADQNKATLREFYDKVFNTGNADLADQFIAADAIDHEVQPGQKDPAPALANFKAYMAAFRRGFPDLKVEVEDLIAEGDKVVARVRITGTNTGSFNGMPPTGKSISVESVDIIRFVDGKCVEHWGISDDAGMMTQLGMMPPPPGGSSSAEQPSGK